MKKTISLLLCLLLSLSVVSCGSKGNDKNSTEAVNKVIEVIKDAESIYKYTIDEKEDQNLDVDKMYGLFVDNAKKVEAFSAKLKDFSDDKTTNSGKTVLAAKDYLSTMKSVYSNVSEMIKYAQDFEKAVKPLEKADFEKQPEKMPALFDEAAKKLSKMDVPGGFKNSHNDFMKNFEEAQNSIKDLYDSAVAEDMIRLSSAMYRVNRIPFIITDWTKRFEAEVDIMDEQSKKTIKGPFVILHDELFSNTEKLKKDMAVEISYSYQVKPPEPLINFTSVDAIFPSAYRSMNALVTFTGYYEFGEIDVLIEVEIPGFTQPYKQKVTLNNKFTSIYIIPPLVTGSLDLNNEKTAQLIYSVKDNETGKAFVQESKNIRLYSKFDMIWFNETTGQPNYENILAWLTPSAPEILALKRSAIDWLNENSEGQFNALAGYQEAFNVEKITDNTLLQVMAIQAALGNQAGVRYNMAPFSTSPGVHQRVMLPADVLNSKSGICIETSLVVASALQSAGMNVMLVFPPGHAMVAVETWPETGEYFLIETTQLPVSDWDNTIQVISEVNDNITIINCALASELGILAMNN